ncbi:MAG: lecithin retinol acyltransferase family protein [Pseudomonadales bacterium]|nr:lecithin retinol acyltransferase family protein [Pseudomonadales bacterium]
MTSTWNIYQERLLPAYDSGRLTPGAHLITPRRRYVHHGIYAGSGRVVHYAGLCHSLRPLPVEEVSLEVFTCGQALAQLPGQAARFQPQEVVNRARSRVGENAYDLLNNNCEHFCHWCITGQPRSEQVEWLLELSPVLLRRLLGRVRRESPDHAARAA